LCVTSTGNELQMSEYVCSGYQYYTGVGKSVAPRPSVSVNIGSENFIPNLYVNDRKHTSGFCNVYLSVPALCIQCINIYI